MNMPTIDPNHPTMIGGRRHGREVIEAAAKVVRAANVSRTADATATLNTALQLVISAALVDGFDPNEAYTAAAGFLAWMMIRLSPDVRQEVLTSMVRAAVNAVAEWDGAPRVN